MKLDEVQARDAFAALSQPTRLRMVRALVVAGPEGMAAGAVAGAVGAAPSSASFHLASLERAGLVTSQRMARSIVYAANYPALAGLVDFLTHDCCQGHPEVCVPAVAARPCDPPAKEPERAS
ncbi:MAG: helix-turn-helix transcriptional regulator [Rhodovulum sp.]|nr:helix-turn-helix transcriptional regulator [Paracoccaceae bacterium]MCC0065535.1 helix-turn-helix transcriptional regulator [Rhodovulum sp.]